MDKINALLASMLGQRVYFDANVFIYFLDQNERYFPLVLPLLRSSMDRQIFGVTGLAAVTETLVGAYQRNDPTAVSRFKHFFSQKNFLNILHHNEEIHDTTAILVAHQKLKMVDALHFATAIHGGCTHFVTNDAKFKASNGVKVVLLDDCL